MCQAEERQHHPVQQEEGEVQKGRILLEEKEGWKDDERRPHEAEGPGHGGLQHVHTHLSTAAPPAGRTVSQHSRRNTVCEIIVGGNKMHLLP